VQRFIAELQRRNVFRIAAIYAGSGWLVVQIVTQVLPFFDVPGWVIRLSIGLVVAGFPLALLLAWLYEITPAGIKRESESEPADADVRFSGRKLDFIIIGLLGLVVLYFLADKFLIRSMLAAQTKSIAVLPFADMSSNADKEYFSDGLTEELTNRLSQIEGLSVVGRTSAFQFKGKSQDLRHIGETLGAGSILEGSVRSDGEHMRITAELVNAENGYRLWSHSYDGEFKDIFAVQEKIADAVAVSMQATLFGASNHPAAQPESNLQAYNAYLQGHFYEQRHSAEGLQKAISFYNEAVLADPHYARVFAGLSRSWFWLGEVTGENLEEAHRKARENAEIAVSDDPNLAEGHDALGQILLYVDLDPRRAESEFRRAGALEPAAAEPKIGLATVLGSYGLLDEAVGLLRAASSRDPLMTSAHFDLAGLLSALGRHEEARVEAAQVLTLQPNGAGNAALLAAVEARSGRGAEAQAAAQMEIDPEWKRYALALAEYTNGDQAAGDAALAEMIKASGDSMAYQIAVVQAFRGDGDAAFSWLERAYALRDPGVMGVRQDPFLRDLRKDPRFEAFCTRLGLPGSS
jgi:TolB-like protein/Tfp pilus assembly protein PilF